MTREEARQAAEVMMAYAEGREIEFNYIKDNCPFWEDVTDPMFNWVDCKYRIKPEPKYRPFKNAEECWGEMLKHQPFGWLKNKKTGSVALIGNIHQNYEVFMIFATNEESYYNAFDFLNEWLFADGTPFGIKED